MGESGVPGENHQSVASHWQTVSYNCVSSTPRHEWDSNSQLQVGTGSCKSNYHTITTTTTPPLGTALRAYENEEVHEKNMLSGALNF